MSNHVHLTSSDWWMRIQGVLRFFSRRMSEGLRWDLGKPFAESSENVVKRAVLQETNTTRTTKMAMTRAKKMPRACKKSGH